MAGTENQPRTTSSYVVISKIMKMSASQFAKFQDKASKVWAQTLHRIKN
jgi:hypothetical protein